MSDDEHEEWKPVAGYEHMAESGSSLTPVKLAAYEVSNLGRVRSNSRTDRLGRVRPGRLLKPNTNPRGHRSVQLAYNGSKPRRYVHELVATAFIGQRPNNSVVIHLDRDPANCRADNLAYSTRRYITTETVMDGEHVNARKTHCRRGHAYSPDNTYIGKQTSGGIQRVCRTCIRERARNRKSANG